MASFDLVIRNAYTIEQSGVVDIAITDGTIAEIGEVSGDGSDEIDAADQFVSPGLVDCHLHIDKAFAAAGERVPRGNDQPFDFDRIHEQEAEYYRETPIETITENAVRDLELAAAAGTTYARSHVSVDTEIRGTNNMQACINARDRTSDLVDLQLVPMASDDGTPEGQAMLMEAIEMGMDGAGPGSVLLGGSDPATRTNDIDGTLETWFDIAQTLNVDMDVHLHEGGTLGIYTLERLAAFTQRTGYDGRVTVSHAYALAHIPDWWVTNAISLLAERGINVVTCYQSTRPTMPVKELLQSNATLGHGTDNDCDFVFPHGNADSVEAAVVLMNKLHGDRVFDDEYRWFDTNAGLAALWDLLTYQGARAIGVEDEYGIEVGNPANLVVFDVPSPQWAIARHTNRRYVIKDGQVIARNGTVRPELHSGE